TDTSIILTRSFKAPRRIVCDAMTKPDKMKRWMIPPPGWTLASAEVDGRVGGSLKLAWTTADGNVAMTLEGEWSEFSPHSRMVHTEIMKTAAGMTVLTLVETHELSETDGVTLMRITQTYESKEARD